MVLALNCLAGNSFQRTTGLALLACQSTVHRSLLRVIIKLVTFKDVFLQFPTYENKLDAVQWMETAYSLPNFPYAVDGMMVSS